MTTPTSTPATGERVQDDLDDLDRLAMALCDLIGPNPPDDFKQVIIDADSGKPPTFELMFGLLGETIGMVLAALIEHPEHLRVLLDAAEVLAADNGGPT